MKKAASVSSIDWPWKLSLSLYHFTLSKPASCKYFSDPGILFFFFSIFFLEVIIIGK